MESVINHTNPVRCIVCRQTPCHNELTVCPRCIARFQRAITERCNKCGKLPRECQCHDRWRIRSLMFYGSDVSKLMMFSYKYHSDERAVSFLALMAVRFCALDMKTFDGITYVPRSPRNIRRYGFDQSLLAAETISREYNIPVVHLLKSRGRFLQKLLSRSQRINAVRNKYSLINLPQEKYKKLLLIDDVTTTGATIGICAQMLRESAAKSVIPLVIAKTKLKK